MSSHRDVATLGVGGPVGSGKTSLISELVPRLCAADLEVGVIANDILTQEDADALQERFEGLIPEDLVAGVETGACPHTGIREDPSMNLAQIDEFVEEHPDLDIVVVESGGDNLAATFNPDLAEHVGADLGTMERDARTVRDGPFIFTNCKTGEGIDAVVEHVRNGVLFA